jgi:hypothetical protein
MYFCPPECFITKTTQRIRLNVVLWVGKGQRESIPKFIEEVSFSPVLIKHNQHCTGAQSERYRMSKKKVALLDRAPHTHTQNVGFTPVTSMCNIFSFSSIWCRINGPA